MMEELIKQINNIFTQFFREEAGNRLSQFAFVSFHETVIKMIKDYKEVKK